MSVPNIKMYRSDTLVEVGTLGNPIDFGLCNGGETTPLPYDLLIYNDKDGSQDSIDAKSIEMVLLRLYLVENWVSTGAASQSFVVSQIPVTDEAEETVTVNGVQWTRVTSFASQGATATVYTFNYTTGTITFGNAVEGAIPPNTETIEIEYTPDLNVHGKEIFADKWISVKSDGVVENEVHIVLEEGTKEDDDYVNTLRSPFLTEVVGVWDNSSKTGVNFYLGGSYDADTGRITLGTPFTSATPYIEYKYKIKDEAEPNYIELGDSDIKTFSWPIPKTNAKRLQIIATVPDTADTEGGAYLKVFLRVRYVY